jgi:glycosyltransferase involved in cell wall biosynthesis
MSLTTVASLIIPTMNRSETLRLTLDSLLTCRDIERCELIFLDDGSTDDTSEVLSAFKEKNRGLQIRIYSDGHKGVAAQRNRACSGAVGPILIFAADDIRPLSTSWISDHIYLHALHPEPEFAVLGKITWPSHHVLPTNAVMATVQGRGGEQFGYADLQSNSFVDWRFFYTSNLSVKKNLVTDWQTDGFDETFPEINFEDIEFAYRLYSKNKLKIFYSSVPTALHHQEMSVLQFCKRQRMAGRMAKHFVTLHGELAPLLLPKVHHSGIKENISIILRLISGLKAYVEWLEISGYLGTEEWHTDLLHCVFLIEFQMGTLDASYEFSSEECSNFLEMILRTNLDNLNRSIGFTLFGTNLRFDPSHQVNSNQKVKKFKIGFIKISLSRKAFQKLSQSKMILKIFLTLKRSNLIAKIS